jgi:predicted lysophospholipase L1 biosynthesis ABC-type transport system permease subunit
MSIIESLAGRAIWSGVAASIRSARGHAITITSPGPQETLSGVEISGVNKYFPIRGALKVLPKDHEIWLLVQDESTGLVWPQGFFPVQFNHQLGTWMGKINESGRKQVRIYAAVAPPTSQEFFRYYQAVGKLREYKFEPLKRVPVECRNRASVQAFIP